MGIFSAIADSFKAMWQADPETTNEDELTLYQQGNEEHRRVFSESIKTIKDLENRLDEKPSKKKDKISPKAQIEDTSKNKTGNQKENQEEREM